MHVHMYNEPQVQFLLGLKLAFLPCSFKAKVCMEVGGGDQSLGMLGAVSKTRHCVS